MNVFVLHKAALGYDIEDRPTSTVLGVYSTRQAANFGRLAAGGTITEIAMDYIPESHKKWLDKIPK